MSKYVARFNSVMLREVLKRKINIIVNICNSGIWYKSGKMGNEINNK